MSQPPRSPESSLKTRLGARVLAVRMLLCACVLSSVLVPAAQAGQRKPVLSKKPVASKTVKAEVSQVAKNQPRSRSKAASAMAQGRAVKALAAVLDRKWQPKSMRGGSVVQLSRTRQRLQVTPIEEERPVPHVSFGELAGLRSTPDALDLKSSVALVVDQDSNQVLFRKNDSAVLPIASLTKLMTGLIISEAKLPLDELILIDQDDVDTEKHSRSRLRVGTTLTRGELLHLALMASENRAAHALGRTFPGGLSRFVSLMNARALMLGMKDTRYVEPTGLSSANQSSAMDLATLVSAAYRDPLVRELSTSPGYEVEVGNRVLQFNNTNRLVRDPDWEIGLQKTGYILEAGQCLVMQARIAGRKLIMVFLDSTGKMGRIGDAERVRRWIEATHPGFSPLRNGLHAVSG